MNEPLNCPYRIRMEHDQLTRCRVVEDLTGLSIIHCHTNDSACAHCLKLDTPPQAPNTVTASMAVHACTRAGVPVPPRILQQLTIKASTLQDVPCIYRGQEVRKVECKPCQAGSLTPVLVPAYSCSKHGECTLNNTGKLPRIQGCITCGDRTASVPKLPVKPYPATVSQAVASGRLPSQSPYVK